NAFDYGQDGPSLHLLTQFSRYPRYRARESRHDGRVPLLVGDDATTQAHLWGQRGSRRLLHGDSGVGRNLVIHFHALFVSVAFPLLLAMAVTMAMTVS